MYAVQGGAQAMGVVVTTACEMTRRSKLSLEQPKLEKCTYLSTCVEVVAVARCCSFNASGVVKK